MAQDIRDLFERERNQTSPSLPKGHEGRFLQKLEKSLPQKPERRLIPVWLQLAAASVLFICLAWVAYSILKDSAPAEINGDAIVESPAPVDSSTAPDIKPIEETVVPKQELLTKASPKQNVSPSQSNKKTKLTLADLSPDLKKVETYFISSINAELANLKVTPDEQEMVDAYLEKVKELGQEYENLTKELNTIGVNDMTITALIENLKMRLQLLQRLKKNLNQLKKENHDKDSSSNI